MEPIVSQFFEHAPLDPRWQALLQPTLETPAFAALCRAVEEAYACQTVFPPRAQIFAALNETPPEAVRCVLLGQDPYHEQGQAQGLSFSVPPGQKLPPSLKNILKERQSDLGLPAAENGCLLPWAKSGVLLLNTVLTVTEGQANSHAKWGWQEFTDALFSLLWALPQPVAFLLWGKQAEAKLHRAKQGAGGGPRLILTGAHPSPLSAYRGFFGSRPFSQIDAFLIENGQRPIGWAL